MTVLRAARPRAAASVGSVKTRCKHAVSSSARRGSKRSPVTPSVTSERFPAQSEVTHGTAALIDDATEVGDDALGFGLAAQRFFKGAGANDHEPWARFREPCYRRDQGR